MIPGAKPSRIRRLWGRYRFAAGRFGFSCEKAGMTPLPKWVRRLVNIALLPIYLPYCLVIAFTDISRFGLRPGPPPEPGVIDGEGFLDGSLYFGDLALGDVLLLKPWKNEAGDTDCLLCAGSRGAVILTHDGVVAERTQFPEHARKVLVVGDASPPRFLALNRKLCVVSLYDAHGKALWSYPLRIGIGDLAMGDLNDDGSPECVIATNAWGGLHAVDLGGQCLWKVTGGNLWCVAIADADGDEGLRIYHSHASGELFVRDRFGHLLKRAKTLGYLGSFCLCHWPDRDSPTCLLHPHGGGGDRLNIIDIEGTAVLLLHAPDIRANPLISAANVRLVPGEADYLAVLLSYPDDNRSFLYVYDKDGALVYYEVYAQPGAALMARSRPKVDHETLLVGGTGRVWEYYAVAVSKASGAKPRLRVLK